MQIIFGNLFENALFSLQKASGERRIDVVVTASEDGTEILFRDMGPGIAAELQGFVFQPYFSTKPMGGGVGLSRVSHVLEEYKGSITLLQGGDLSGATFRIYLPSMRTSEEVNRDG